MRKHIINKISIFSIFILISILFYGCGGSGSSFQSNNNTTNDYVISGQIYTQSINGSPVRETPSINDQITIGSLRAVLGKYDPEGNFNIFETGMVKVQNDGSFKITLRETPDQKKNLVVRIIGINEEALYESVLPILENGENIAAALTIDSYKQTEIIKVLTELGLHEELSIGEVLSVFTPSMLNSLSNEDINTFTRAILGIYRQQLELIQDTSITEADMKAIKEHGFKISKDIIEGIETGRYLNESAWKSYLQRQQNFAMEYLADRQTHNNTQRRAPVLSASDIFTEVDTIFKSFRDSIVKMEAQAKDGNIQLVDFETGEVRDIPVRGRDTVMDVMTRLVENETIYKKSNNFINELIKFSGRINKAVKLFNHSVNLSQMNGKIDDLILDYQNAEFPNAQYADDYIVVRAQDLKKYIAAKFSELMWEESNHQVSGIRELNTLTPQIMLSVITKLSKALDPSAAEYDQRVFNIFSNYSGLTSPTFNPVVELYDVISEYIEKTTLDIKTRTLEILYVEDYISNAFYENLNSLINSSSFSWDYDQKKIVSKIMANIIMLQIDRPLEVMDYQGMYYEISGTLKRAGFRVGNEYFQYKIVDSVTGKTLAYVRKYQDYNKYDLMNIIETNPLYSVVDTVHYIDPTSGVKTTSDLLDFKNNLLWKKTWYLKFYENYNIAFAIQKPNFSYNDLLEKHYRFKGLVTPPYGVYENEQLVDFEKFATQPLRFYVCDFEEEDLELGPYLGENVENVFAKILWNKTEKAYYVVNAAYDGQEYNVSPYQKVDESYEIYDYWKLDYSNSYYYNTSGQIVKWDPNDFDLDNEVFTVAGQLKDRVLNGKISTKTFIANFIQPEDTNSIAEFTVTGILSDFYVEDNEAYAEIRNVEEPGALILKINSKSWYEEINQWFEDHIGDSITVGDPDPNDDSDGITYSITDAYWDDAIGAYYLPLNWRYDQAITNGKPDWAKSGDNWSFNLTGKVDSVKKNGRDWTVIIKDNDTNNVIMQIYMHNKYSNTKNWFDNNKNKVVIIGDPDIQDDSDGVVMEVLDVIYNDNRGYYELTINKTYDDAFTNTQPDWGAEK